jgi:transcription elongation factor GreA
VQEITMTAEELESVRHELHQLETEGRRAIAARIKTAREWGDLKENAEYHAAKEDQAHLETRILKLRDQVRSATVVETISASDSVRHGSTVSYTDRATNRQQTFRIVAPNDASPSNGSLSAASPIAQALMGRKVGDVVELQTPKGTRTLTVDAIG